MKVLISAVLALASISAQAYDFSSDFHANTPALCNDLMATRFVNGNKTYFSEQLGMRPENKEDSVSALQKFTMADLNKMLFYTGQKMDAWTLSLIPSSELRQRSLVYALNFKFPARIDSKNGGFDPLEKIQNYSSGVEPQETLTKEHVKIGMSVIDALIQDYSKNPRPPRGSVRERDGVSKNTDARNLTEAFAKVQSIFGGNFTLSSAFCMDLLGFTTLNCAKELDAVADITAKDVRYQKTPGIDGDVILLNYSNYAELLENPKNIIPLLFAAKTVLQRFHAGTTDNASFFDDLKNSFVRSGLNLQEAEELQWRVIGIIGTAGANLVARVRYYENGYRGSRYALSIIAGALPYLDHASSLSGMNIYSFPKSVKATCNSGKSYHFLMAAYLSRSLAQKGLDSKKSAAIVYQFAKAYNGPVRDFLKANTPATVNSDSAAGDVVRIDLSYSASGAIYGAFQSAKPAASYNVDETLLRLYNQKGQGSFSFPLPDLAIFRGVKSYIEAFNPNVAFETNLNQALSAKGRK